MNKILYEIIIGDNSFFINVNESMQNILKSSFNKDVKILEVKKQDQNAFENDIAKINAKSIYDTMKDNWSTSGKLQFISEFMELLTQEKNDK